MLSKKRGFVFATILTLFSFLSVAYLSCTKTGPTDPTSCDGIGAKCTNGSHCYKGRCQCPVGYEGVYCETMKAKKYHGTWNVTQRVTGSDSVKARNKDTSYVMWLKPATPTTFLIDNFYGDSRYNNIICTIDSLNQNHFVLDTITPMHMLYNAVRVMPGADGFITDNNSKITIRARVRHLTSTANWQMDTVEFYLTRSN